MMDGPHIVIVIPTRNRRQLLERAVESALAQSGTGFRAIIVNDASSDDTVDYLNSLGDPRIAVINREIQGGVNAARNQAIRTISEDEWALMLDDDDFLLPGAIDTARRTLAELPRDIDVVFFNTRIRTQTGEFEGGYQFGRDEEFHDPTYLEVITKSGLRGDCKPVIRGRLFAEGRLFEEGVNGFESEFYAKAARDGVHIRYVSSVIMNVDQSHGSDRLSNTAAVKNRRSFLLVHRRLMSDHGWLFRKQPHLGVKRALDGLRIASHALAPASAAFFLYKYMEYLVRGFLSGKQQ